MGTVQAAQSNPRYELSNKYHQEMGFHDGCGKALDQLIAMLKYG